ncbi:MAG: bestrophin family protein [Gemmataceae bacterium]
MSTASNAVPWFDIRGTPVARKLFSSVALVTAYSTAIAILDEIYLHQAVQIQASFHALIGTVLGIFLVFRTNTAYDRWWEGRKLWGQLVNDSRNLAIKVRALHHTLNQAEMLLMGRIIINFARALKEHLREGIRPKQLSLYKQLSHEPTHVPANISAMCRERIKRWRRDNRIDGFEELQLDVHARAFMDICGACERIRRTPLTRSYVFFIRQSIFLYLLTLPWGLIENFNYWTIAACAMIAYFMVGIELIAETVEEPFGREEDDLTLDAICSAIEASVSELLAMGTPAAKREPPASILAEREPFDAAPDGGSP